MKILKTSKVKTALSVLVLASVLAGCVSTQDAKVEETLSNKQKVVDLLSSIENGNKKPIGYINPNKYIQHNLAVKDGLAGFGEVMSLLPKNSAKANVIRAFEDGNFVFTHTKYNFFGPKIGFDIFRFEDGKIVEHWDNLQNIVLKTASGRTQIDGEIKVLDLNKTKENKELVKNLLKDVFFGENPNNIIKYISSKEYKQHNPYVKDGLAGLGEAIKYLSSQNDMFIYKKVHKILGEGNFVLSISEGSWHNKPHSFYDLFRINNGKIVEHWDTIEEILPKNKRLNSNGKFNIK